MKLYSKEQLQKEYKDRYIEVYKNFEGLYELRKVSEIIRENMTLGQDLGTGLEYTR